MTPGTDDDDQKVNSLSVTPTEIARMAVRGTQQLAVTVDPADARVFYHSADVGVATVTPTGTVTGVGNGDTVITVSAGDKKVQIPVSVQIDL